MPLQHEIAKRRPFDLPEEEAWLNVQRTAAVLRGPFDRLFRDHGLTDATYNVLRILRGVHREPEPGEPDGVTCSTIAARLVTRAADVTRLVDRLVDAGLAERVVDPGDRRRVRVRITPAGRDRVVELDEPVRALHRTQLGHLAAADLQRLNVLLAAARRIPDPDPEPAD